MVVTLGQQYNVGEKATVTLYTYINRHIGLLDKTETENDMSLDYSSICYIWSRIEWVSMKDNGKLSNNYSYGTYLDLQQIKKTCITRLAKSGSTNVWGGWGWIRTLPCMSL